MTDATLTETAPEPITFRYDGRFWQFAGIVALNTLLQLLTLGIFRFWARTRERRYLWSHTALGEDRLEYTGTGMELFLGFLIALLVLVPFFGLTYVLSLTFGDHPAGIAVVQVVYLTLFLFLYFMAAYRARRYRLSRTLWRGIRGTLTGSSVRYALAGVGYYLIVIATGGLAGPVMRIGLVRREMENTHFGNRPFGFDGRARDLMAIWLVPWLGVIVIIGVAIWMSTVTAGFDSAHFDPSDEAQRAQARDITDKAPTMFTLMGLGYLYALLAFGWYRVREFRYLAGRVTFEGMRFSSRLSLGRVMWIYISFILTAIVAIVAFSTLVVLAAMLASGMAGADSDEVVREIMTSSQWVPLAIGFSVVFLVGVLSRVMVFHRMAHAVVSTLGVTGSQDLSQVSQALDTAPSRGEGLADAFDLGDF